MTQTILTLSFNILLFFTPLFFTPLNSELFEYNKMLLVYYLTTIIVGTWLIKMLYARKLILKRTPLDIPILLFLASQILSTIFSVDPHTSIWGYYSRSNGGLLSIISYILLFYAFVSNFDRASVPKFLKWALYGGLAVSLYALPEHFGKSPSCKILVDRWSADCWVQDVQSRVFATLGQPNWLAAYLAMLIFPALYFFLTTKEVVRKFFYFFLTIILYTAFTFTYSRGATLGLISGLAVFFILTTVKTHHLRSILNILTFNLLLKDKQSTTNENINLQIRVFPLQLLGIAIISLLMVNILFGSALTGDFRLIRQAAPPPRPGISVAATGTQLESGGTESGQIRLIVWQGAINIFKSYPLFGSGVETFAYTYYQHRPDEHNNVSEWDFLYNKAHNEFLNYLATTGAVGFISYLFMIVAFILWSLKRISTIDSEHGHDPALPIFLAALLASYISYLVQNIFGFSVVMIALLFYLFPGFAFVSSSSTRTLQIDKIPWFLILPHTVISIIYKRSIYQKITAFIIIIFTFYFLLSIFNIWRADINYKIGSDHQDKGSVGEAFNSFRRAVILNRDEPLYLSELGSAAASSALASLEVDATQSAEFKDNAIFFTQAALEKSPANVSLWRTAIRAYYELSILDPSLEEETIKITDQTIKLAPNDPKVYYNKALILSQLNRNSEAIEAMKKALELKPNYREARLSLVDLYIAEGQTELAKEEANTVLKQIPNDPDALQKLQAADAEKPAQ
jgi:putative inorganic carbon (hco3(-)) transporter